MSKKLITRMLIIFSILGILSLLGVFIFAFSTRSSAKDTVDLLRGLIEIVALVFGAVWVLFKLFEYREFMDWIQLDIDKNLYRLGSPVNASIYSWEKGKREQKPAQSCTHAIEVILRVTNKGKIRVRLYNIQISIFTMSLPTKETKFDEGSGYLSLEKILTSGNIVGEMHVDEERGYLRLPRRLRLPRIFTKIFPNGNIVEKKLEPKPIKESSFYYIEPGVQQEITYLALIPQPQELLQVAARFNLEPARMFPEKTRATTRDLYPHTAARTFQYRPRQGWFTNPGSDDDGYQAL